jgi:hypothetical protein
LSLIEREEISRGFVAKRSLRSIAESLNRSPSTISREVRKNGGRQAYRATRSDQRAWDCASRPKLCKLSFNDPLCQLIARKLRRKWSPQQIAGWLKRQHPNEEQNRVSHETIYRSLYVQTRGVLKKELQECLRSPRAIRRSRHATQKGLKLLKIKDAIPISERPPEVEDRAVPGHWEGDLIIGSNSSYIATLVERHSRFVMLAKVENKDTQPVILRPAACLPSESMLADTHGPNQTSSFQALSAARLPHSRLLRFLHMPCLQNFGAVHSSVHNHFNQERHFYSRDNSKLNRSATFAEWRKLCAAKVHAFGGKLRLVRIRLAAPRHGLMS